MKLVPMMRNQLIISVIGLGNVGRSVVYKLLADSQHQFLINIIDPSEDISGSFLDLGHAATITGRHRLELNNFELLNTSEFIFHCAGASVPMNSSRLSVVRESIRITDAIFKSFKSEVSPWIIVVSNPVDIISYHTHALTGEKVIGTGTLLDTVRMKYHLSGFVGTRSAEIETMLLGEHGDSLVWLKSTTKIGDRSPTEILSDTEMKQCLTDVKNAASKIKATQGATYYAVADCAIKLMNEVLNPLGDVFPASVLVPDGLKVILECKNMFLSLPVNMTREGVEVVDFVMNEAELNELKKSAQVLQSQIELIDI